MAHKTKPNWQDKEWCDSDECICDIKQSLANISNIAWSLKGIDESLKKMAGMPPSQQKKNLYNFES